MAYHVNPRTGNPNICRANKGGCPFGGESEHFDNKIDASKHFEKIVATAPPGTDGLSHFQAYSRKISGAFERDKNLNKVKEALLNSRNAGVQEFLSEHTEEELNSIASGIAARGLQVYQFESLLRQDFETSQHVYSYERAKQAVEHVSFEKELEENYKNSVWQQMDENAKSPHADKLEKIGSNLEKWMVGSGVVAAQGAVVSGMMGNNPVMTSMATAWAAVATSPVWWPAASAKVKSLFKGRQARADLKKLEEKHKVVLANSKAQFKAFLDNNEITF